MQTVIPSPSITDGAIIRPLPRRGARLRLFCFPYAGGSASAYRAWAGMMPDEVELCAVQLPGRENRGSEPLLTSMADVVDTLSKSMEPYLDLPFAFFGHSMGSHIAFEMSRSMLAAGKKGPVHLFASGRHAPHMPDENEQVHALPRAEFIDALRRLQGTPEEILDHVELMEMLLPILRADFTVCETYTYSEGPSLRCPISGYFGDSDPEATEEHLGGWAVHTMRKFDLKQFEGTHFFIHSAREQVVGSVVNALRPFLLAGAGRIYG